MTPAIELHGVTVAFGDGLIEGLDLAVQEGECVALVGPSRSGKSLIVELCAGLFPPLGGRVAIRGRDWASFSDEEAVAVRRRVGTVLQQAGLLSNATVFNNVALPLRYHRPGMAESGVERAVMAQLEPLGLAPFRGYFPAQLNPGEIRCAATARAMVLDQDVLLLDDPVAGLDAGMVLRLREHLVATRRVRATTVLITLRGPSPLTDMVDRVALVEEGTIRLIEPRTALLQRGLPELSAYVA